MKNTRSQSWSRFRRGLVAIGCAVLLVPGEGVFFAQAPTPQPSPAAAPSGSASPAPAAKEPEAVKLPPDQLDALVAPIALYPDPLLAQTLVASTYPLEII
jgi:hypothetical protein